MFSSEIDNISALDIIVHIGTDVVGLISAPSLISEEDESAQVLVGLQLIDGPYNNNTVALLAIQDQSEGNSMISLHVHKFNLDPPIRGCSNALLGVLHRSMLLQGALEV